MIVSPLFLTCLMLLPAAMAVLTNLTQLPFDQNDRLQTNFVLYPDNHACHAKMSSIYLDERDKRSVSKEVALQLLGEGHNFCGTVCLEKGVHRDSISHPLATHVNAEGTNIKYNLATNCQTVEVGFINYASAEAYIYWINQDNERVLIGRLKRGEKNQSWHTTYLGHQFQLVDVATNRLLKDVKITHNAVYFAGENPSAVHERHVNHTVQQTFDQEWRRAHEVQRTFTEMGFAKARLPAEIFASMSAFYYNNQNNAAIEEWGGKGLFVNWWQKDVYFIPMPLKLKSIWQKRMQQMVEEWTGVEMEPTSIYGMRRYEEGARLLTHVDREETHAASMIINVAQGNIRAPWKVEIYDLADRLHEVEMQPGDVVFYESARCLHGRMQPLQGDYYVNLFTHYRPRSDGGQWYRQANPPNAPAPLLNIGSCTSNGTAAECDVDVPYLSPSLQTLQGPQDLYEFWKNGAPSSSPATTVHRHEGL